MESDGSVNHSGMAYTVYCVMTPLGTAGTLHDTSASPEVISLTLISRGGEGAVSRLNQLVSAI